MDKRKAESIRVKQSITNALFALMREKSLSDIQVTELVNRAGGTRTSFYSSKETVSAVCLHWGAAQHGGGLAV